MQIDPENMLLLEQHLACASAESYLLLHSDQQYFGTKIFKAAETLISEGKQSLPLFHDRVSKKEGKTFLISP